MTFKEAITFHVNFTLKLMSYCKAPDGSISPEDIVQADGCALGKWIAGMKNELAQDPQMGDLERAHIAFHESAARVVRKVNSGFDGKADVAFGSVSEYGRASVVLTDILDSLSKKYV